MNIQNRYDIFISFKDSDENGNDTEDKNIARELYQEFKNRGFKVFFSPITFKEQGTDEWNRELKEALYFSKIFIAVGTKKLYMDSHYVKWERDTFLTWKLKDKKRRIYAYIVPPMDLNDLPNNIKEISVFTPDRKEDLYEYVTNYLKRLKKIFLYKVAVSISLLIVGIYLFQNSTISENSLTLERKDITIEHKNIELERKDIVIERKDMLIEKLQKELNELRPKYNNEEVLIKADAIKNILGSKEGLGYLKNKDIDYTDFDKWLKKNISKVAILFASNTKDNNMSNSGLIRKGTESENSTGTIKLKSSDEHLVIRNTTWSPLPIRLELLNDKGNVIYTDINKDSDDTLFVISNKYFGDGYKVLIFDGFGDLVVDVELEI